MWWRTPIILALVTQRQEDRQFDAILGYLESSGSTWTKDSIIKEKERGKREEVERGKEEEGLRKGKKEKETPPMVSTYT